MHKIGLKLWNINIDFYLSQAAKLFEQNIFDYIELYIVPQNLDKLDKWAQLNIPFDIHAPHSAHKMNLSKKEFKKANIEKYQEVKLYADKLNASAIIFHGGAGGDYKETATQLAHFNDPRTLIENKPYETLKFVSEPYYVGAKFEELKYIIEKAHCGFCLDIGHCICTANSFGIDPYSYIEKFITLHPSRIHLSDIDINTTLDAHLNYGKGSLDFKHVLNILPSNINITVETNKSSTKDLNDFIEDVYFLRRIIND